MGWWGWADQGQYLRSAQSFAQGTWRQVDHFYPPVYPWLGSWFVRGSPGHPFFLVDYAGFALHVGALLLIGRGLCGWWPALIAVVGTFVVFPDLTMQHWAEPWTTSVSAGIGGLVLLVVWRFAGRGWRIAGPGDWVALGAMSFALGMLVAVRPLDLAVFVPLAVIVYARIAWALVRDRRWRRLAAALAIACVAGSIVPLLFVRFNLTTSGTIVGSYVQRSQAVGYNLEDAGRKFVSLLFDGATVYGAPGETIAGHLWPFFVALPVTVGLVLWGKPVVRFVALTVLVQFAAYLPYADLTPTSLYRYANVHYFKWTFPWLVLLTAVQGRDWFAAWSPNLTRVVMQAALVAAGVLAALAVGLAPRQSAPATITQPVPGTLAIALPAGTAVDFIDLPGLKGSFDAFFNRVDDLEADGHPLRWLGDYKLVPIPGGARLVFGRQRAIDSLRLRLDPAVDATAVAPQGRAVAVGLAWGCRFRTCPPVP